MDRVAVAVAMACAGVTVAAPAVAQAPEARTVRGTAARPLRIEAVDVEQVTRLAPGVPLVFTVYGSPGAVATLAIDTGAREPRDVAMREVDAGVYEATVTVRDRDRFAPDATVVATLRMGGRLVRESLREALVLDVADASDEPRTALGSVATRAWDDRPDPADARAARDASDPRERPRRDATDSRDDVDLRATPVARSQRAPFDGADPAAASPAGATRRVGRPVPFAEAAAPRPSTVPAATVDAWRGSPEPADVRSAAFACADCATVESIRALEGDDAPQRAGAFASAVTGTVLGERFGDAHGRRVTKIWNVLSGRRADASGATRWEVVLRDRDGAPIVRRYDERPLFAVGESVRLGSAAGVADPRDPSGR